MPIRINLLAEAQAAEEARRRDPVKRGLWIGGFIVSLVVIYIAKLYGDMALEKIACSNLDSQWTRSEPKYIEVLTNQTKIVKLESRLQALDRFSTNRFLWGPFLNALQQATVDDVEISAFSAQQSYSISNAAPPKAASDAAPAAPEKKVDIAIEKISLTINARDWSASQQSYRKFINTLSAQDYIARRLGGRVFTLKGFAPAIVDKADPARSFLPFTLECRFPEVARP